MVCQTDESKGIASRASLTLIAVDVSAFGALVNTFSTIELLVGCATGAGRSTLEACTTRGTTQNTCEVYVSGEHDLVG